MPILKELKKHKLLLDTHVWIWSLLGSKQLAKSFQKAFEQALKLGYGYQWNEKLQ